MKKHLINLAKFLFASSLIYWLFSSGKLSLEAFKNFFSSPEKIFIALLLVGFSILINTLRWQLIIEKIEGRMLSFKDVFTYGWIGLFFSIALPGIVSGDVIKAILLKKKEKQLSVTKLIASTLIDRIFGLAALIMIMGSVSILNYSTLAVTPEIRQIIHINFVFTISLILGVVFLFTNKKFKHSIIEFIPSSGIKNKLYTLLELIENIKKGFHLYLGLSLISQSIFVFTFYYLMGGEVEFMKALTVIPLGFITLALPIAPGGIGVGHVMFEHLFLTFSIKNGAVYFNNYFLLSTIVSLSGFVPYILSGNNSKELISEAETIQ